MSLEFMDVKMCYEHINELYLNHKFDNDPDQLISFLGWDEYNDIHPPFPYHQMLYYQDRYVILDEFGDRREILYADDCPGCNSIIYQGFPCYSGAAITRDLVRKIYTDADIAYFCSKSCYIKQMEKIIFEVAKHDIEYVQGTFND